MRAMMSGTLLLLIATGCKDNKSTPPNSIGKKQKPSTHVVQIFPSSDVLPANHLKFYIDFPGPMERGDLFEYFSLIENDSGKPVQEPFREVELWDESGRRLTLWFHPGRQKPGVNLNVEIGPILEEGKNYTLIISGKWQNELGQPLGNDVQKQFRAGPMDNTQPNPDSWQYSLPEAGTTAPLSITFPNPLDYALIPRTIQIQSNSNPDIEHDHNDLSIRFIPAIPWKAGEITISIDPKLEDLSGNSIARPFNLDLQSSPKLPEPSITIKNIVIK
jgi:hypothetical protein